MRVTTKKRLLVSIWSLVILITGILIGIAISRPYFKHGNNIDLTLARLHQTYDYVLILDKDASVSNPKLINKLVFDLGFHLDRLVMIRQSATNLMKARICEQSKDIVDDKQRLIQLALQTDSPEVYSKRLKTFIEALEGCDSDT